MAEFKTLTEIRNYPLSNGETADLIKLISADRPSGWVRGTGVADFAVGTVAYVAAMGSMRRGVTVKVTKTKVHVAITTQGAVDEAARWSSVNNGNPHVIRVQIVVADPETAFIAPREAELVKVEKHAAEMVAKYDDPASRTADAQDDQVQAWLARHAELGTPHTQWSDVEDYRQADHAEAMDMNEASILADGAPQGGDRLVSTIEPDTTGVVTAVRPGGMVDIRWTRANGERGNDHPTAAEFRDSWQIVPPQELTLDSQAGKVISMNNDASTETAPAATAETTGSAVVLLLEKVWSRIRENHPELPAVVIVTGAGLGIMGGKWGHFRPNGWAAKVTDEGAATDLTRHEMFMAGETLAKGARQVLQTMLHEGAHTLAQTRNVQDTSRQGRWHNKVFRKTAEEMGLEYTHGAANPSIGFSQVTLKEETVTEYADLLDSLDREISLIVRLPGYLVAKGQDGDEGGENMGRAPKVPTQPNTNNVKATCLCEEPRIIRLSRKVLEGARIMCEDCDASFQDRS